MPFIRICTFRNVLIKNILGDPTVCVTGAGAGVDSVREQEKLEARKMLENAAESPASSARFVSLHFMSETRL
jgi:hypothetical protein